MGNYNCYSSWDLSWIAGNMLSPVRGPRADATKRRLPWDDSSVNVKVTWWYRGDDSGQFFGGLKKNTFFGGSLKDVVNFWEKNMFGSAEAHHMRSTCRSFNHPDSGRGLTIFSAGGSYGSYGSYAFRASANPKAGRDRNQRDARIYSHLISDLQNLWHISQDVEQKTTGFWAAAKSNLGQDGTPVQKHVVKPMISLPLREQIWWLAAIYSDILDGLQLGLPHQSFFGVVFYRILIRHGFC